MYERKHSKVHVEKDSVTSLSSKIIFNDGEIKKNLKVFLFYLSVINQIIFSYRFWMSIQKK